MTQSDAMPSSLGMLLMGNLYRDFTLAAVSSLTKWRCIVLKTYLPLQTDGAERILVSEIIQQG